jgi:hypothetical protein
VHRPGDHEQTPLATSHFLLGAQSASLVQVVLHAATAQAYGEQLVVAPAAHTPLPLHVEGDARFALPLHEAATQTVVAP